MKLVLLAALLTQGSSMGVVDDVVHLVTTLSRLRAVQALQSPLTFEEHFRKKFPSAS